MVFISGNMPMKTEIAPLLIVTKLEQYDYAGATAIAAVMLLVVLRSCCCSRSTASQGWRPPQARGAVDELRSTRSPDATALAALRC